MIRIGDKYQCKSSANSIWNGEVKAMRGGVQHQYITIHWTRDIQIKILEYAMPDFKAYMSLGSVWKDQSRNVPLLPEDLFTI
jgi:hypothetical protein